MKARRLLGSALRKRLIRETAFSPQKIRFLLGEKIAALSSLLVDFTKKARQRCSPEFGREPPSRSSVVLEAVSPKTLSFVKLRCVSVRFRCSSK